MFFNDRMVAAMITIGESGRINLYQLAKRSHTNRTYVGALVRRMESLGLVTVEVVGGRNPVYVAPTDKGRKVGDLLKESSKRIWNEISSPTNDKIPTGEHQVVVGLSPRFSLVLEKGLRDYSFRLTTPDGNFSFNADMDRAKLEELGEGISSILNATRGSSPLVRRSRGNRPRP